MRINYLEVVWGHISYMSGKKEDHISDKTMCIRSVLSAFRFWLEFRKIPILIFSRLFEENIGWMKSVWHIFILGFNMSNSRTGYDFREN